MSVLLLHLEPELAVTLTRRLTAQADEVRWAGDEKDAAAVRDAGAFIARGDITDDDFIWRASLGCRTVVFMSERAAEELAAIQKGAGNAEVERLICVAPELPASLHDRLSAGSLEYVIVLTGGGGWLARRKVSVEQLAEAVDAADDKAGPLHEVVDLTEPVGWLRLGLTPPQKG